MIILLLMKWTPSCYCYCYCYCYPAVWEGPLRQLFILEIIGRWRKLQIQIYLRQEKWKCWSESTISECSLSWRLSLGYCNLCNLYFFIMAWCLEPDYMVHRFPLNLWGKLVDKLELHLELDFTNQRCSLDNVYWTL